MGRACTFLFALWCTHPPVAAQVDFRKCKAPVELEQKVGSRPSADSYNQLGSYFGQEDRYPCAIAAFRASLRLDPKSWQTHSYLGMALLANHQSRSAVTELQRSLQINPDQPNLHMTLGAAFSQLNQIDAAIAEFKAVLRADPKSVTALDWLSKSLISEKRYDAAISVLKNAPPDVVLQLNLVIAYSKTEDNETAIQILTQMIKDRPAYEPAYAALASIYTQQNRLEDAVTQYQEALRLNPKDDLARVSYVKALVLLTQFRNAQPIAQDYLTRHPNEFEALYLMGVVDLELDNLGPAKDLLTRAVRQNPNHYDSRYSLGAVLSKLGELEAARKQLEAAVRLDPSSTQAHFRLATVLRSLGLQDEARKELDAYKLTTSKKTKDDIATTKSSHAEALLRKGDARGAADSYKDAIEENPADPRLLVGLALALDRNGDVDGERKALAKAIQIDPRLAVAHNQLGILNLQAEQIAEAEQEFKTAISLRPHYAQAENNLGTLYGQQGDDAEAEQYFRHAIDSDPGYVQAFINLGATLASEARFSEAEETVMNAIHIDPDNREANELLTMIRNHADQQNRARRAY